MARDVLQQSEHADDRRRKEGRTLGLVVERNVPADHRYIQGETGCSYPFYHAGHCLPDSGALRVAKVQTVSQRHWDPTGAGDVATRLRDNPGAADVRVCRAHPAIDT